MVLARDCSTHGSVPKSVLILTSLAGGSKHGYAITADVESFSGVTIGPGTLYGLLDRLEREGLIEALPVDRRRNPYGLTGAGWELLALQLEALDRIACTGNARIGMHGS